MNLIFDAVIAVSVLLSVIMGAKRGFIKSVMGVCTLIAALFVAYAFTPPAAQIIGQQKFIRDISVSIADTVKSLASNDSGSYDLNRLYEDMPDAFTQILTRYGMDIGELTKEVPPDPNADAAALERLADLIAGPAAAAISSVLAFLALFVASVVILKILTWILDTVFQLPVLKTANTMLGFLFGVVAGVMWACVLSSLSVTLIRAMSSISPDLFNETVIENSVVLKFFSNLNPLVLVEYVIR